MKANAAPLLAIFEKKMRLDVPMFQRQYVWTHEQQWEPLWEDISRKFTEFLEGRKDGPVHFLGAMVLDQKQTPTTHVERRQVIDGQQRLTTLQIFLVALRDFAQAQGCEAIAGECDTYVSNKGMMSDPQADRFKVWPTQADRSQFVDVITLGSKSAIEKRHPIVTQKWARNADSRPRMIEAYFYFYEQLGEYFLGTGAEPALAADVELSARLEECLQALRSALHVVVIDLEQGDDAQVIFETLNARGEPLLPADLLRNYIFLRAARTGESQEALYEDHWSRFDDPFWRTEVKQGRLNRPRSDLYLQHFLASRKSADIPIKHLFAEYKHWINTSKPFPSVREEVATLARQGDHFRRMIEPKAGDVIFRLVTFLDAYDIRTAYPLLLQLLDSDLSYDGWREVSVILESYLVRRAVLGYTTKNYNRVFLSLTRVLRADGISVERIRQHLSASRGESAGWPDDATFRDAWLLKPAYPLLQNAKLVHIFKRLDASYRSALSEEVVVTGPLSVEHLLPQSWIDHWPLGDGATGMAHEEIVRANPGDARASASKVRHGALQTMGNLTIVTQALNASVSNGPWDDKRTAILLAALLPINQRLHAYADWNEHAIATRGLELFEHAARLWPAPNS